MVAWTVSGGAVSPSMPGEQVWIEDKTAFRAVQFGGKTFDAGSRDAKLLGARYCSHCATSRPALPGTFLFCPDCGAETLACEPADAGRLCHWPSFDASGWAERPDLTVTDLIDRRDASPKGGKWGLTAAGAPAVLTAYDHEHGLVLRYDGDAGWKQIARVFPSALRPWQRALIAARYGFFFAAEDAGLGFVPCPFVEGVKAASSVMAQPAGGPGLYEGMVCMPAYRDGKLILIGCPADVSPVLVPDAWRIIPVEGADTAVPQSFGAPYANGAGDLFWSSAQGYIAVSPQNGGAGCRYLPWRDGFAAFPAARPYRSPRFGGVWQLVQGNAPGGMFEKYAYHLATFNPARQDVTAVEGPHLSYGSGTFRGDKRYDDPCVEAAIDYEPASDNNVYIPLAVFGTGESVRYLIAIVEGRAMLTDLLSEKDLPVTTRAGLFLIGRLQGAVRDLKTSVDIRSLHHLSAIVHDGRLFVYANYESRIYSWRIVP